MAEGEPTLWGREPVFSISSGSSSDASRPVCHTFQPINIMELDSYIVPLHLLSSSWRLPSLPFHPPRRTSHSPAMKRSKDQSPSPPPPPPNPYKVSRWTGASVTETEEEVERRLQAMQDAIVVSKRIDMMLQESKKDLDRRRKGVKILLLGTSGLRLSFIIRLDLRITGQSESGKVSFFFFSLWATINSPNSRAQSWRVSYSQL